MKFSPVHYKLRATYNRRLSTTVHSNRLKPYVHPNDRPLSPPDDDANDPYLSEFDFPADSFNPDWNPTDNSTDDPTLPPTLPLPLLDSAEHIVQKRIRAGKPKYLIKRKGYPSSPDTCELEDNIIYLPKIFQITLNISFRWLIFV